MALIAEPLNVPLERDKNIIDPSSPSTSLGGRTAMQPHTADADLEEEEITENKGAISDIASPTANKGAIFDIASPTAHEVTSLKHLFQVEIDGESDERLNFVRRNITTKIKLMKRTKFRPEFELRASRSTSASRSKLQWDVEHRKIKLKRDMWSRIFWYGP